METLTLKTSDEALVEVDFEVLKSVSKMIKSMFEIEKDEQPGSSSSCIAKKTKDEEKVPIKIENVNKHTLDLVMEWAKHYLQDQIELDVSSEENSESEPEADAEGPRININRYFEYMLPMVSWERKFVENWDRTQLMDIILAAYIMEIDQLLGLGLKKTILMIKGKSDTEAREFLFIENCLSPEFLEEIRNKTTYYRGGLGIICHMFLSLFRNK